MEEGGHWCRWVEHDDGQYPVNVMGTYVYINLQALGRILGLLGYKESNNSLSLSPNSLRMKKYRKHHSK